jgi:hypothetical protein
MVPRAGRAANGKRRMFAALPAASILLAPIAYWRYGSAGLGLLAVFGFVIVAPYWPANWIEARFARRGGAVAGLLAATAMRMLVPLVVALVIVVLDGRLAPVESVLLMVPLYLSVLYADTVGHVQHRSPDGPLLPLAGSPRREQG